MRGTEFSFFGGNSLQTSTDDVVITDLLFSTLQALTRYCTMPSTQFFCCPFDESSDASRLVRRKMASPLPTHADTKQTQSDRIRKFLARTTIKWQHRQPLTNNQNQSSAADSGQPDNFFGRDDSPRVSRRQQKNHVTQNPMAAIALKNNKHKFRQ